MQLLNRRIRFFHVVSTKSEECTFNNIFFGRSCGESKDCFICAVSNRTRDTFVIVAKDRIKPRLKILSDCLKNLWWYTTVTRVPFCGETDNHFTRSVNFKDPVEGTHTNTIEILWGKEKRQIM